MDVFKKFKDNHGNVGLHFHCPGCNAVHGIFVEQGPIKEKKKKGKIIVIKGFRVPLWKWNGDMKYPTVKPSILVTWDEGMRGIKKRCHSFVGFGSIKFLNDCTHDLRGQTVKLKEF